MANLNTLKLVCGMRKLHWVSQKKHHLHGVMVKWTDVNNQERSSESSDNCKGNDITNDSWFHKI